MTSNIYIEDDLRIVYKLGGCFLHTVTVLSFGLKGAGQPLENVGTLQIHLFLRITKEPHSIAVITFRDILVPNTMDLRPASHFVWAYQVDPVLPEASLETYAAASTWRKH